MIDATKILSEFASRLSFDALPSEVIEQTRLYIADYFAACCAGYKVNDKFNRAILSIVGETATEGKCTVLFTEKKYNAAYAAYLNAIYAHGADMDDGNRKAMGHVAAHVMSTAFAVGEQTKADWKSVFTAINVGYEVYNRVAAAAQPDLVHRGFHSTGTAGAIACAAVAAKLMGLNEKEIYDAMGIASIQASGLIIIAVSGQSCKPINPANAARTGIISAELAKRGIDGPVHPLEDSKGWFHAMADSIDESMITDGLGSKFTICESYLKPYPSCRHTHCGIEAGIKIHEKMTADGRDVGDIKEVNVYIYENAIKIAGQIIIPKNPDDAKFSIHYSLAMALQNGRYTLDDLNRSVSDESIALTEKIRLITDSSMENTKSGIRGARVEVVLYDGKTYMEEVLLPKGDAANPFSWEDMRRKIASCTENVCGIDRERIEKIRDMDLHGKFVHLGRSDH